MNQDHGRIVFSSQLVDAIDQRRTFFFGRVPVHPHEGIQHVGIVQRFIQAVAAQKQFITGLKFDVRHVSLDDEFHADRSGKHVAESMTGRG